MISYRKLAMRVLGHSPVSAPKTARRRSTAKRAAALALTAALVVGMTLPAFAQDWFIENGDIEISAGESGNKVVQNGEEKAANDTDTVIKSNYPSTASSNSVTIEAGAGKTVDVTLDNVNINTSETGGAAVSVTGKGDTNIELDGNNTLTSGYYHAGLEHNKTDDSGTLTITDNNNDGKLTANGGYKGAGIGGGNSGNGAVTITGGDITANGGYKGAGIGGGYFGNGTVKITDGDINANGGYKGAGIGGGNEKDGQVTITGGEIIANGGDGSAGIGGGYSGNGTVEITGGDITANGGDSGAGIGGGDSGNGTVNISGGTITKASGGYYGAGIGGGASGNGTVTITGGDITANGGDRSAGIGGGKGYYGQVTITGGEITANGGNYGAGIGGGASGEGTVTISGGTITKASGGDLAAGIGGGAYGNGTVNISGGTITEASGGDEGAGIGGGSKKDGQVTITGGEITATGGLWGAGIGGGVRRLGNVSIEGNVTIKNAKGGAGAAGIGGGAQAEPDDNGTGSNQISIKSTAAGSPTITATGGGTYEGSYVSLPGAAAIGSGSVADGATEVRSDITIEGKVTIDATGGGNVAIGANNTEQTFSGLQVGTKITRRNAKGDDVSQPGDVPEEPEQPAEPEKPAQPTVTPTEGAEAPSTGSVEVERPVTVEGLYVTNVLGKQITHTCTQNGTTLTIRANGIVTSAHLTLGMVRTLKAQGVKTLVFTTLLSRSTTVSVDALLAADPDAPDETAVVWTHTGVRTALTIGGADHSALLK